MRRLAERQIIAFRYPRWQRAEGVVASSKRPEGYNHRCRLTSDGVPENERNIMQIDVYSVPLLDLLALSGSGGHEDLLDIIRDECSFVDEIDDMIDEYHAMNTGSPEEHVSFLEAVRQILEGKPLTANPPFIYANAYEAICFALGDTLCNVMNYFQHTPDELDQFFSQSGIPLRFKDLRYAGPLLEIPHPGDYPFMGWWTPDQICRAITPPASPVPGRS